MKSSENIFEHSFPVSSFPEGSLGLLYPVQSFFLKAPLADLFVHNRDASKGFL